MVNREAALVGFPLFVVLILSACDTLSIQGSTEVRIENSSTAAFDHVSYWAGNSEVSYADVASGGNTPYVEANGAYGYTTTQVVVGADTVRLQIIDFVGETSLSPGRYTYVLGLDGTVGNRTLTQGLREDP